MTATFLQHVIEIESGRLERRCEAKYQPGDKRESERKSEDAGIETEIPEKRHRDQLLLRYHCNERRDTPVSDHQTCGSADERQQNRLSQQLPHNSPATRSQRRSDRNLFLSRERSRQQQTRDVRASNQQYKTDSSEQDQQDWLNSSDDLFL